MGYLRRYTEQLNRLLVASMLLFTACANPVSPTGGPKDTTAPSVTRALPGNQSINFNSDRVIFTFSEFVVLKEITTQLVVSPPLEEQPEFTLRGKSLIMKFKEPLRSNTTYNFFFGDAIVDITESNPLAGYQFTFSTGPVLDSLSISGKLINAFNNLPVKGAFVMLYDSIYDSIPYKTRPYYLARTGTSGEFSLNNLRDGNYLMFAITDINANYMYDLPTEEIAFADSLLKPGFKEIPKKSTDTLVRDSTLRNNIRLSESDTLQKDTVSNLPDNFPPVLLRQFREADSVQRLFKSSLIRENVLGFVFSCPVRNPVFTALNPGLTGNWYYLAYNTTRDTLTLWIPEPGSDSLRFTVSETGMTPDTIELSLKPREKAIGRRQSAETIVKKPVLTFRNNLVSNRIKPNRPLLLIFAEPVSTYDFSKIKMFIDSLPVTPTFRFADSVKTRLVISHPWKEEGKYRLSIPDSIFSGIFGTLNDSLELKFTAFSESETASINLNIELPETGFNYIVQLLGDKEAVMEQLILDKDGIAAFRYLTPRKYKVKVIIDRNNNQRWDTGNYLKKMQPEQVLYHPTEFELRANWTLEEDWKISFPPK